LSEAVAETETVPETEALFAGEIMLVTGGVVSGTFFVKHAFTTPISGSPKTASVHGVVLVRVR
jgi:hypothetical protein